MKNDLERLQTSRAEIVGLLLPSSSSKKMPLFLSQADGRMSSIKQSSRLAGMSQIPTIPFQITTI